MTETDRIARKKLLREALSTIVVCVCDICGHAAETPANIDGYSNRAKNAWFYLPIGAGFIGKLTTCSGKNCYVTICNHCKIHDTSGIWVMFEKQVGRGSPYLTESDYTMVQGCRDCFDQIYEDTTTHHYDRVSA